MKKTLFLLIIGLLWQSAALLAQKSISLHNGTIAAPDNINDQYINRYNSTASKIDGYSWTLLQFKNNPSPADRKLLLDAGIELTEYIPKNLFVASISKPLTTRLLKNAGILSMIEPGPEQKTDPVLLNSPDSLISREVLLLFFKPASFETVSSQLAHEGFVITGTENKSYNVLQVQVPPGKLSRLAMFPFVEYIEAMPPPPKDLMNNSRNNGRANILNSGLPGDYHLTGEGVTVGIGEIAALQGHIDFKDRLVGDGLQSFLNGTDNYHSTHVHGIVGSAGLVNELYSGFAPKATLLPLSASQTVSQGSIATNQALGMVISNNSYITGAACSRQAYSITQYIADKEAIDFDYLQHVFGGGNSGTLSCSGYPIGFNTILANYHSAKSILSVGATYAWPEIGPFSSRGPAGEGRIKPEIVAQGTYVMATVPNDSYGYNSGTSMSGPAVAGGLALLYQRYRQLHNGNNPKNSLMKAVICNTATDLGNKGPDYTFGFGFMNLLRAVKVLDNAAYFMDSVSNQITKSHTINVPAGTAQLKVMLYWQDPPASLLSTKALVNDLDLLVVTPASVIVPPYILDTLPALVANPATRGEDHLNNIEQVVIDNPTAGLHAIKVNGRDIQQNPWQQYVVVYDIVPDDIQLTFPNGGECLLPGEPNILQWDSWGHPSSTFQLQYSPDNGITWQMIDASIAADLRQYTWQVPVAYTTQAKIKLVRNEDGKTNTSRSFVILGAPALEISPVQCRDHIAILWPPVAGVTDYEVMMVKHGEMVTVDSTTNNFYLFSNLSADSTYFVSVRGRIGQFHGRRGMARSRKPDSGTCSGNISDNDLKADSLMAPLWGRAFTSHSLGNSEAVRIFIRNLDDAPASGFTIKYAVNNGPWISEDPVSTIPANTGAYYTFVTPYDFSATGNYQVKIVVKNPGDNNALNDTLTTLVRNIPNPVLNLSTIVQDDFEQSTPTVFTSTYRGLPGAIRFDYEKPSGTGMLAIIPKAVSDTDGNGLRFFAPIDGEQSIIATYNLSAYDTAINNVGMDFNLYKSSLSTSYNDTLYVRGNDGLPWIPVMSVDPLGNNISKIKVPGIALGGYLKSRQQNFSSSFQLRWSQQSSLVHCNFDNIRLFDASKDLEVFSLDSLKTKSCSVGTAVPIRITLRSRSTLPLTNVPVKYRIDNGAIISETINIPANASMPFTFATAANLSVAGFHTIEAWTELPGDTYTGNDRQSVTIRNQPTVIAFPYLQDFESGQANWYAEGVNNSWKYGLPASPKIKDAASGNNAWKTTLNGNYNNFENSFLYSPCFDVSALDRPVIGLSMALNIDSCGGCDFVNMQFSTNGTDWKNIASNIHPGYNWQNAFRGRAYTRWHVISCTLPDTVGLVQFRFNMRSDFAINYEGMAIDDIHIYDSTTSIYEGVSNSNAIQQAIDGGNSWIDFKDNGQIIASIQPRGQHAGATSVQAFLQNGNPHFHGQYYLKRSFAIKTNNPLTDSIGVRLYFLDAEADSLLFAGSCPGCFKSPNAYRFGISQYKSTRSTEINGLLADNTKGDWSFINPASVRTVPYQKGYYIEFKTKDPAELWLNNGGYNNNSYLPVEILHFTVTALAGNNITLQWQTASEINIQHFDIQVAKGNQAYQQDNYSTIGQVQSRGSSSSPQSYNFEDPATDKKGVYYYRLKITDQYGNYSYSRPQAIVLDNEFNWSVAPNISAGLFQLNYQANARDIIKAAVYNNEGTLVKEEQFSGNGFIAKHAIDLRSSSYASGLYIIKVQLNKQTRVFKIIKH